MNRQTNKNNYNIIERLEHICMAISAVFPLLIATVLGSIVYVYWGEIQDVAAKYFWGKLKPVSIIIVLIVFLVILVAAYVILKRDRIVVLEITACFGIFLRILFWLFFYNSFMPFSDALNVWNIANGERGGALAYRLLFPEWSNLTALCKLLVGKGIDYGGLIGLQVICSELIAVCIFLIAMELMDKNKKISLMAIILYLYMPSQLLYLSFLGPDILALTFVVYSVLLFIKANKYMTNSKKHWLLVVLSFCLLGVGISFKSTGLIVAIAYTILLLFGQIKLGKGVQYLSQIILLAFLVVAIPKGIVSVSEQILDGDISSSSMASYLCVGLNTEGEGQIHLGEKSRYYNQLRLEGYSTDDATKLTLDMLYEDWSQNKKDIPLLLVNKIRWAWQDDLVPAFYFGNCSMDISQMNSIQYKVYCGIRFVASECSQLYYCLMVFFAFLGICYKKNSFSKQIMNYKFLVALVILGYALVVLLVEAQSRYKANIMPFIIIASVFGIEYILEKLSVNKKRIHRSCNN